MLDSGSQTKAGITDMQHPSLKAFLQVAPKLLHPKGPYALILLEDGAEVAGTVAHALGAGFREVLVFGNPELHPADNAAIHLIAHDMHGAGALTAVVNSIIDIAPDIWLHYCYNAEYLIYPFCESRTVGELTAFTAEERRHSVMTYVVDLYSKDLGQHPNAVAPGQAYFDTAGYYALQRFSDDGEALERQLDFFGGLRWRFEEHVPWSKRRIDRVALFRAYKGLRLDSDHRFNDPEYNTYCCAWHHNISATICSFRTAKALMNNPGSKHAIKHFWWKNSAEFEWSSNQLMQLGLMEPGQWF